MMDDLTIDARRQELLEARFWGASKVSQSLHFLLNFSKWKS